ncbi:hypothetical protein Pelo_11705 [Pelomyxa schiedti]|nr:hypothetical protein Pelo_11705 [Pelomyxa schiedti]
MLSGGVLRSAPDLTGPPVGAAHRPETAVPNACVFMFDEVLEGGCEEEVPLYFHPQCVSMETRMWLVQTSLAMRQYTFDIFKSQAKTACLAQHKIAFHQLEDDPRVKTPITIGLLALEYQPDAVMHATLEQMVASIVFFYGSVSAIRAAAHSNRTELIKSLKPIGNSILAPFIDAQTTTWFSDLFQPILYTRLQHKSNKLFLRASQILFSLCANSNILSGCMFYGDSVLCTHADLSVTQCILRRLPYIRDLRDSSINATAESSKAFTDYYLVHVEEESLRLQFPDIRIQDGPVNSDETSPLHMSKLFRKSAEGADFWPYTRSSGLVTLGMHVTMLQHITLVLLMHPNTLSVSEYTREIFWKTIDLPTIEQGVSTALGPKRDADLSFCPNVVFLVNRPQVNQTLTGPQIVAAALSACVHMAVYDSETRASCILYERPIATNEMYPTFQATASVAHRELEELRELEPGVYPAQLALKSHVGTHLSKFDPSDEKEMHAFLPTGLYPDKDEAPTFELCVEVLEQYNKHESLGPTSKTSNVFFTEDKRGF